jgi:hypothetical protein
MASVGLAVSVLSVARMLGAVEVSGRSLGLLGYNWLEGGSRWGDELKDAVGRRGLGGATVADWAMVMGCIAAVDGGAATDGEMRCGAMVCWGVMMARFGAPGRRWKHILAQVCTGLW